MRDPRRHLLTIGAAMVACVSLFHIVCAIGGPAAYRYAGAGEAMASKAASGSPWPAVITLGAAVAFGLCSLYGFSAAGRFRPLPLARVVLVAVGAVFTLRGLLFVADIINLVRETSAPMARNLFYSMTAFLIGLTYLLGPRFRAGRAVPAARPS